MIKLPCILSDGCVLEKNARIWGCAAPYESVTVRFRCNTHTTTAGEDGRFEISFCAGDFGGPHTLEVNNTIITDVYVGYVWLCGGQSNMELPVSRVRRVFKNELDAAYYPEIRGYLTEKRYIFNDKEYAPEGAGIWLKAVPEELDSFYAAAFFFARNLYETLRVPIGLIMCAAGGSAAESWLSPTDLQKFPIHNNELALWSKPGAVPKTEMKENAAIGEWFSSLDKNDPGIKGCWFLPGFDDSEWDTRNLTTPWDDDLRFNGSVWFRKEVELSHEAAESASEILLGVVVDSDFVYINGEFIGRVEYRYPPSIFSVPKGVLKPGKNTIAVRAVSCNGIGGFVHGKNYKIACEHIDIPLDGEWKYRVGAIMPPCPTQTPFYTKPCGFYYGMLKPVIGYTISGVIWYQGETNANDPNDYYCLMNTLITSWRGAWNHEFPFIFVQLANYEANSAPPPESKWAELRDIQRMCLAVPKTAMITAVDIGEYNDLHPLDKKTVGERLALAARGLTYGETNEYKCPLATQAGIKDGKLIINIENADNGLTIKHKPFTLEIETTDGGVFGLTAKITGDNTIETDFEPAWTTRAACVRYAWADNPHISVYGGNELPLIPFRLPLK